MSNLLRGLYRALFYRSLRFPFHLLASAMYVA